MSPRTSSRLRGIAAALSLLALLHMVFGSTSPLVTSAQGPSVPDQPVNFDAVEGDTQVWLTWDPPAADSPPITKYQLWRLTRTLPALTQPTPTLNDEFGYSVAMDGNTAVVGMPGEDYGTVDNAGAAFVFDRDPDTRVWTQVAELRSSTPEDDAGFGNAVALHGGTIVVSAPNEDGTDSGGVAITDSGAVYVFTRDLTTGEWGEDQSPGTHRIQTAKLEASDAAADDEFGSEAVAVDGDTIVAGARNAHYRDALGNVVRTTVGVVCVFAKAAEDDWTDGTETAILSASDGATNDRFGHSVAIDDDTVVVGANGDGAGSAYVFIKAGDDWADQDDATRKLTASGAAVTAGFGQSVAIDGDTIVVGANTDANTGSAFLFSKPALGWATDNEDGWLTASDGADGDLFGHAVAVDGDIVVVGAPYEASGSNYDRGSAYVFAKPDGGWDDGTETAKVPGPGASDDDQFGWSLAVDGDTVLVGADWYGEERADFQDWGAVFEHRIVGWSDIEGSTGATTSHALTGLANGVQESVAVRAVNDGAAGLPDNASATPRAAAAAPLAPRNLSAVQTAAGEVRLEWRPSDYPLNVTRYEYSTDDGSNWIGVSGSDSTTASGFVSSLAAGTHTFTIRAGNSADDGGSSHARSVTIVAAPPTAPTALDPYVGDRQAQLRWSFSGDQDLISGFQYQVRSGGVFGNDWTDVPGGTATTSHSVTGLTNDTSHSFRVRAVNGAIGSAASNEVSRLPTAARSTPASPRGLAGAQVGVGRVALTWSAASQPLTVTGYQYTDDGGSTWIDIPDSDSSTASYTVSGLTAVSSSDFAVRAVNSFGRSGSSNSVVLMQPRRPVGLSAEAGDTQATVNWRFGGNTPNFQLLQIPLSKLTDGIASDDDDDEFGYSVALDGDIAVVGAPGNNSGQGAAYVFTRDSNGWGSPVTLAAATGAANDAFGHSVAVDGNTVIVGAYTHDFDDGGGPVAESGAAYVFTGTATTDPITNVTTYVWEETATLVPSDRGTYDEFGISVAIDVDTVVIGAHQPDPDGAGVDEAGHGAAYVFSRTSTTDPITNVTTYVWGEAEAAHRIETAKLTATDGAIGDGLGISVAIDGDTVLVGAHKYHVPTITDSVADSGGVYVFNKTGDSWSTGTETALLTAANAAESDEFGISVAIDDDSVVIGAHQHDANGWADAGAAYVFSRDSRSGWWSEAAWLVASDGSANDGFGVSVAVDGVRAVVGAHLYDQSGLFRTDDGSAYVFSHDSTGWRQSVKLVAPGAASNDEFGHSVALSANTVLAGAPQRDPSLPDTRSGFAYVMEIDGRTDAKIWTDLVATELRSEGVNYEYRALRLTNAQEYGFQVRSVNDAGNEPAVEFPGVMPISAKPGVTSGLSAQGGDGLVTLRWDRSRDSSISGYQVAQHRQQKLSAGTDGQTGGHFGFSVAVDGGTAVVGAPGQDAEAGAAYVFVKDSSGWGQRVKLTADGGAVGDMFGHSVAIEGNTIVIGAPLVNSARGLAYVFTRNTITGLWSQTARLSVSDGDIDDEFAFAVAVHEQTIVVGARFRDHPDGLGISDAGAAYVFMWNSALQRWDQEAKLTALDPGERDYFGYSVAVHGDAVHGDTVVIGASNAPNGPGSAYLFTRPSREWADSTETAELTDSEGDDGDQFGSAVAVYDDTLVIGARNADAAYLFTRDSTGVWPDTATATLTATGFDNVIVDGFGSSVAVHGDVVVVGAPATDIRGDDGSASGAAFVFTKPSDGWADSTETATLILPAGDAAEEDDLFGNSVDVDGQYVVVGASDADLAGDDDFGAIYASDIAVWKDIERSNDTTAAHTVRGLSNGSYYYFQVRAVDGVGDGPPSYVVWARPTPAPDSTRDVTTGLWSDGATLWLAQNGAGADDAVYAYDIESRERVEDREFELDKANVAPRGLWSDGATIWVSDSGKDKLFAHDLESGERLPDSDRELARDNRDARGIWSDGVRMWVLDGRADALFAYDLETGALLGEYELDSANNDPRGLWSDGVSVWVSDHGTKRLFAYRLSVPEGPAGEDAGAGALERVPDEDFTNVTLSANNSPRGIWSDGDVMYVADASDDRVYSYNMPDAIDARLASLTLSGVEIGEFSGSTSEYAGVLADGVTETTVEADPRQDDATVLIEPADRAEDADGHQAAVAAGAEVTVTVTSPDGSRTKVYRVRLAEAGPSANCLRGAVAAGFSLVVFEGGSIEDLVSCAQSRHVSALYTLHDGAYLSYILGAPDFVNRPFRELFAAGVPALSPLIARSDGPPSPDPTPDGGGAGVDGLTQPWPECLRGAVAAGFSLVLYEGGSVADIEACAQSRHVTALYTIHDGKYLAYILGAPDFVNRPFHALFVDGVPAITPLIAKATIPASGL